MRGFKPVCRGFERFEPVCGRFRHLSLFAEGLSLFQEGSRGFGPVLRGFERVEFEPVLRGLERVWAVLKGFERV